MVPTIDAPRLLRESAPLAVVVGFWVVLSWFGRDPDIATGIKYAGAIMGLLYAVVRGVRLADATAPAPVPEGPANLLRENVQVALPAGLWFLAANLSGFVAELWNQYVGVGLFTSPVESLSFVFTATGVLTVVLYAVTVGLSRIRGARPSRSDTTGGSVPADD